MKKYVLRVFFAFFIGAVLFVRSLQSVAGALLILLVWRIKKRCSLEFPLLLQLYYGFFLVAALFLGETLDFYYRIALWDNILHMSSGFVVAALGYSLVNHSKYGLGPCLKAVFAFSFSMMVGALWEIFEFAFDFFFGANMQKFLLESGVPLMGERALFDTMTDLSVCALGAICFLALLALKCPYMDHLLVKKVDLE